MTWPVRIASVNDNEIVTPHELMQQLIEYAGTVNGVVDRENVERYQIESVKLEVDSVHDRGRQANNVDDIQTVPQDLINGHYQSLTTPLLITPTLIEGVVHITAGVTIDRDAAAGNAACAVGLFVDDQLICRDVARSSPFHDRISLHGVMAVAPGVHRIEVKIMMSKSPAATTNAWSFTAEQRCLNYYQPRR